MDWPVTYADPPATEVFGQMVQDPGSLPFFAPRADQHPCLVSLVDRCVMRRFTRKWFDDHLALLRPAYPRLRLASERMLVQPAEYAQVRGPIFPDDPLAVEVSCSPQRVEDLLGAGATAVWDRLEEIDSDVAELTEALRAVLPVRVQSNLYVTQGNTEGFGLHADSMDVLAMQASGRKRWILPSPDGDGDLMDVILEEGQGIYIPRGFCHRVVALGETSAHVSMGFSWPTLRAFLQWAASRLPAATALLMDDLGTGEQDWSHLLLPLADAASRRRFLTEYSRWWLPEGRL